MNQNVKILVITVPSWNSKVGANSWATLLEGYPSENVASIYIRDEIPDSKVCSRYFNISENKIIKSVLRRGVKTGRDISPDTTSPIDDHDLQIHNQRYAKMKKKRRYSMLLARELIWKIGRWRTPELDAFLDSFQPDVILHSMDGYIHLNRVIEYAIKRTGAKAIGYVWDDNFTYKQSSKFGFKVYRYFQRKSLKRLAKVTQRFFAITPKTKQEADAFFGIDSIVLTKPLNATAKPSTYENLTYPLTLLYTGNLLIGRDKSLMKVLNCINKIPEAKDKIKLEVYTQTQLDEATLSFLESGPCQVHPPISQQEVLQKQKEADILLFLEDTNGINAKFARLSFSTKITDYLSSGKCIFAVGCLETAPMQYFQENDIAIVAENEEEITKNLLTVLQDPRILRHYADSAAFCAEKNHNKETVLQIVHQTIEAVLS